MTSTNQAPQPRLLRWKDVQPRVGICRSQAHAMIQEGTFPAPVKLGARASAWVESEINDWIDSRISASRQKAGGAA